MSAKYLSHSHISTKVLITSADKYYMRTKQAKQVFKCKRITAKQIEILQALGYIVMIVGG